MPLEPHCRRKQRRIVATSCANCKRGVTAALLRLQGDGVVSIQTRRTADVDVTPTSVGRRGFVDGAERRPSFSSRSAAFADRQLEGKYLSLGFVTGVIERRVLTHVGVLSGLALAHGGTWVYPKGVALCY